MNTSLLATKFHIPTWRSSDIDRLRLVDQINTGLLQSRKLTLISAPAGYGKTTVVSEWVQSNNNGNLRFSWLSLDQSDNDLSRFLMYWFTSFQQVDEKISSNLQPFLDLAQLPPVNNLLDELISELAASESKIVLILDDYHVITNSRIHEAMEYFLEHQPANIHIVITTRADPPFPLARMRVRGQITEIRARDLRFTEEESQRFIQSKLDFPLAKEANIVLNMKTEGWAAGLQMAAIALQKQNDPITFIETFKGSHRFVLDYLAEEVLRQQDEDIHEFLINTCILDRFNADLCEALSQRKDSKSLLHRLEKSNLFIIPLDEVREWYRYHHLFADYLRSGLSQTLAEELHRKAALWHEENGLLFDAVPHALASGNHEFAANVIGRALRNNTTWSGGNVGLLSSWLDSLPIETFSNRPQFCLDASRIFYLCGQFDQAEHCLTRAERALNNSPSSHQKIQLLAISQLYRGSIASVRGETTKAIELTLDAQSQIDQDKFLAHARGYFTLGLAYELSHNLDLAVSNYLLSSEKAILADVKFLAVHSLCSAAQVQIIQGRLSQAEKTCQSALQIEKGSQIPPHGLAMIILGIIALERNDLEAADQYLQQGIILARDGHLLDDLILGLSHMARFQVVKGNYQDAQESIEQVNFLMKMFNVPRMNRLAVAFTTRLNLITKDLETAKRWAENYQSKKEIPGQQFEELTLARVLLAAGDMEQIPSILKANLEIATSTGQFQTMIEVKLLFGLYYLAKQEKRKAIEWIRQALSLAAPEGYLRIFLDEGQHLKEILPMVRDSAPALVDKLIHVLIPETATRDLHEYLPDPLSEQEIRVLSLLLEGLSNKEIAEELFISTGTAKWHVHNVLQKMGVNNRAQAIVKARELGFN